MHLPYKFLHELCEANSMSYNRAYENVRFANNTGEVYRIGDVLHHGVPAIVEMISIPNHKELIGYKYWKHCKDNNILVDHAYLREITPVVADTDSSIATLHLRTSDHHFVNVSLIEETLELIYKHNMKHVDIITSMHYPVTQQIDPHELVPRKKLKAFVENDIAMFELIISYLSSRGISFKFHSSNIDSDFAHLVHAKNLYTTIGGFGEIASVINTNNTYVGKSLILWQFAKGVRSSFINDHNCVVITGNFKSIVDSYRDARLPNTALLRNNMFMLRAANMKQGATIYICRKYPYAGKILNMLTEYCQGEFTIISEEELNDS